MTTWSTIGAGTVSVMTATSSSSRRSMAARIAAHTRWARTSDRTAATAPARAALDARFEREVDPDGVLPPEERARRSQHARTAYYTRLALLSARSRSRHRH